MPVDLKNTLHAQAECGLELMWERINSSDKSKSPGSLAKSVDGRILKDMFARNI